MKKYLVFFLFLASIFYVSVAFSEDINPANNTANTTSTKQEPKWKTTNIPVTNDKYKEYDLDSSGYLEPQETKKMLRDKYNRVDFDRQIDMDIVRDYDTNDDGVLDPREAEDIVRDTSY